MRGVVEAIFKCDSNDGTGLRVTSDAVAVCITIGVYDDECEMFIAPPDTADAIASALQAEAWQVRQARGIGVDWSLSPIARRIMDEARGQFLDRAAIVDAVRSLSAWLAAHPAEVQR